MLYFALFLTFLIASTLLYLFLISFNHPKEISGYFGTTNIVLSRFITGVGFVVFLGTLLLFLRQFHSSQQVVTKTPATLVTQEKVYSPQFEQMLIETYPQMENYYFLYTSSDNSEATLELIAKNIRKDSCTIPCTINFYDNKEAFALDRQRVAIVDPAKMEEWNKAHYVFVADHYLGYLNADMYPSFSYFPYKDDYYQKLKGSQ